MPVRPQKQLLFWGIGLGFLMLAFWFLGSTLLPFVVGAALAYFLDPLADRLEAIGLSRTWATAIIGVVMTVVFAATVLLIVPALIEQIADFIDAVPGMVERFQAFLDARFPQGGEEERLMRRGLSTMREHLAEVGPQFVNSVLTQSLAVVEVVALLFVAPVVAFYLLLDWDRMVTKIDGWLPREHADTIRSLAQDIDAVMSGFVRGQFTVCLILGTFYAVALSLIGLPFGFLVGMTAGALSFIPYVGAAIGGVLSVGIALVSFWGEPLWIVGTAAIFALGQFVEGNVLQPNLVGRSVRLHPVLLILALAVFGKLFGFAGLLVAVPLAASLGVVGRFAIQKYLKSPLYTGRAPGDGG